MQGEYLGLGYPLQSGIMSVQRTYGANHERFTSLLRADGDPVGHGATQELRHGIGVFRRVEVQPGVVGI